MMSGDGVRFFGHLSNEQRRQLIKKAWVLVNPSVREGWGLNVIEASALGTPSVVYDVAGLSEAVMNEKTGLLVKAGRIEELADKTIMVLKDDVLRKELSNAALDFSRRFSWDKCAEAFLKILVD
jgi:glycosyltransferase involved in cell wall biosynthesis